MGDNHMATVKSLLASKKPVKKRISVVMDPELAEAFEDARRARDVARMVADRTPDDPDLAVAALTAKARVDELRAQLEDEGGVVWFEFRGIGRPAYEHLVDEHPVTPEKRAKAKAGGSPWPHPWDYDTFPPALVHACLVEPALPLEEIQRIWSDPDWNQAELAQLFNAATAVNGSARTVELGKDS